MNFTPLALLAFASSASAATQSAPPPATHAASPTDSPLKISEAGAFDGYTLFGPLNSTKVYLVDMAGEVVHEWQTNCGPAGGLYLLDNGNLLRCGRVDGNPLFHGGGIGGSLQEIAWDGSVVWEYKIADETRTAHHDVAPRANGNILVIVWEKIPREDAIELGRDPAQVGGQGLWADAVIEIKPVKPDGAEIVWEWHAWDHLIQDFDSKKAGFGSIPDHPELIDINADHREKPPMTAAEKKKQEELERQMRAVGYAGGSDPADDGSDQGNQVNPDWLHTNAIKIEEELDLIVLSTPHLSELWVIERTPTTAIAASHKGGRYGKGGDLLYRWGNPKNYGAGEEKDRTLYYQHDTRWVAAQNQSELCLLVFNNGQSRPGKEYSSADELVLPFDKKHGFTREAGRAFAPAAPDWSYSVPENLYAPFISGAQRLPNGNTLICSGPDGRLLEVTREKRVVWEFANPHGGDAPAPDSAGRAPPKALFRATRIAKDHPGLAARKL